MKMLLNNLLIIHFLVIILFYNSSSADDAKNQDFLKNVSEESKSNALANYSSALENLKTKNYEKAFSQFKVAAEAGHIESIGRLGHLYFIGEGVEKNYIESAKLLKIAAPKKSLTAMKLLGASYKNGMGVIEDQTRAYFWLTVGRHFENNDAVRKSLDEMIADTESLLSPFELSIAKEQAKLWIEGKIENENIDLARQQMDTKLQKALNNFKINSDADEQKKRDQAYIEESKKIDRDAKIFYELEDRKIEEELDKIEANLRHYELIEKLDQVERQLEKK